MAWDRTALSALVFFAFSVSACAEPVDYRVPGAITALQQAGPNIGWTAILAMLESWKGGHPVTVRETMAKGGPRIERVWRSREPLFSSQGSERSLVFEAFGLHGTNPRTYSVEEVEAALRRSGPLWVTTADGQFFALHGWIVVGLRGDGTPEGTAVQFIDPLDGATRDQPFSSFFRMVEETAKREPRQLG